MISSVLSLLTRLVLGVATAVLVLAFFALALVTLLGVVIWSLLRGRKPVIDVSGLKRAGQFRAGRGPMSARREPVGEVVDVEAREVPTPGSRLN